MRHIIFLVLIVLYSCSQNRDQKIGIPDINPGFYQKTLSDLEVKYSKKPSDRLLRQILYYSEKLDWPRSSITYLNKFLEVHGLDKKIVTMFLQYYLNNEQHAELVALLDKWEFYHGLDQELAQYRIQSSIEGVDKPSAIRFIKDYVEEFQSKESYEFAARQSIEIGDETGKIAYLGLLADQDPMNRLVQREYIPFLIDSAKYELAYDLLKSAPEGNENFDRAFLLAKALYGMDSISHAHHMMRSYSEPQAYVQLSSWYRSEQLFDSATYFINAALYQDSSRQLLMMKGEILEERGWLNTSYAIFNGLVESDTTDSIASQRAEIVARKIAYLRRLREQQENIPVLELEPKKLVE